MGNNTISPNVPNGDIAREAKVFGLEDFICAGIVQDRLGVDARLVREGTITAARER